MPLEFTCPECQKALTAPFAAAGLSGTCKFCHARLIAPVAAGRPATPVPEAASTVGAPSGPGPSAGPGMSPPFADPLGPSASEGAPGSTAGHRPDLPPDISGNPRAASAFLSSGTPAVADFWKRFLGFGIDMVFITGMQMGLMHLMRGHLTEAVYGGAMRGGIGMVFRYGLTLFAATVLYGTLFEGSPLQATPGKFVLGMKVCSEQGARISYLQALWRNACKWAIVDVVGFVPIIGFFPYAIFFYAMRDDLTQTLHDMLAGTVVAERYY